jgi:hypothetical protein
MDLRARHQYLGTLIDRYLRSRKRSKGVLLDEICRNTGQNRKYVIRKLAGMATGEPKARRKRKPTYGREVQRALGILWTIFDYACGQRLRPMIRTELGRLRRLGEVRVSGETAARLMRISPATIDRLLRPKKGAWKTGKRYRRGSPGLIAQKIPLRMGEWKNVRVGQVDMDLVLHCRASMEGEYGHSLATLDVFWGWWVGEVVMGRPQIRIFNALKEIESRCPFPWISLHSDNDNAFINAMLYRYSQEKHIRMTRSRPYHKNDNAQIEQKNYTHVRKPLGYLRYDTPPELDIITDLYRHEMRLYRNFFQPVMKLVRKQRVGGRVQRTYDEPKTPYRRLLESGQLPAEKEKELRDLYLRLNPAELKRSIDRKLGALYEVYQKKKKRSFTVNPYKKLEPSMVTLLMSERPTLGLPV